MAAFDPWAQLRLLDLQKIDSTIDQISSKLDRLPERAAALEALAESTTAQLNSDRAAAAAEREIQVRELPNDLLALYERIRKDNNGIGAAHLQQGRCGGCRLQLSPVALAAARNAAPAELLRCEECRAILVRDAESGL